MKKLKCKHCLKFDGKECELLGKVTEQVLRECHYRGYDVYVKKITRSAIRHSNAGWSDFLKNW